MANANARKKGTPPKKKNNKKPVKATTPGTSNTVASPVSVGSEASALNPPFDPRMRRIGSPLNQSGRLRRGWIQNEEGDKRVNFMYNPPSIDISHSVSDAAPTPEQLSGTADATSMLAAGSQTSTGVTLLYDRTYDMFNPPTDANSIAQQYGVYADIAAWYSYLGLLSEMPTNWTQTLLVSPMQITRSYLFVGPQLVYFGYPSSLSISITHWSQAMIPVRCSINVGFAVLPKVGQAFSNVPIGPGFSPDFISQQVAEGWTGEVTD